jgi:hypothetical protein
MKTILGRLEQFFSQPHAHIKDGKHAYICQLFTLHFPDTEREINPCLLHARNPENRRFNLEKKLVLMLP